MALASLHALWYRFNAREMMKHGFSMFYTLIKHVFLALNYSHTDVYNQEADLNCVKLFVLFLLSAGFGFHGEQHQVCWKVPFEI